MVVIRRTCQSVRPWSLPPGLRWLTRYLADRTRRKKSLDTCANYAMGDGIAHTQVGFEKARPARTAPVLGGSTVPPFRRADASRST
jgi:hypothetical protein